MGGGAGLSQDSLALLSMTMSLVWVGHIAGTIGTQEKANCAWGEQAVQPMPAETAVIFDAFCPDGAFMYVTGTG